MEESGVTKVISARLAHSDDESEKDYAPPPQSELFFEEEEVEYEEARELPPGVNDPSKVTEEELRPIRGKRNNE